MKKHIKEVLPDEVLGEDIFKNDTLLAKKGTKLTKRMLELFKKQAD